MENFYNSEYEAIREDIETLNQFIYDNPELGLEEYKSSMAHKELLEKHGFKVEMPYMGMDTAFRAVYDTGIPGRNIAYLSEYDALPGIGHGCGHNILGSATTGSGILLSKIIKKGVVTVIGTPAEETLGGKVTLTDKGAFSDIDAVLCTHPDNQFYKSGTSLALESREYRFHGKTAHASGNPEEGINALQALILMFNNINAIRQTMINNETISGIITNGGEAANIIPDLAVGRFHIRADNKEMVERLVTRVHNLAEAAAKTIGCTLDWELYENKFLDLRTNKALSEVYDGIMEEMGIETIQFKGNPGSLDMGNVSYAVPSINPNFKITDEVEYSMHTVEFRDKTLGKTALKNLGIIIKALAATGERVIEDDNLYSKITEEFKTIK
ncbi:MAG: M20 family metallopeptidase [Clostridiaceae bacterium]